MVKMFYLKNLKLVLMIASSFIEIKPGASFFLSQKVCRHIEINNHPKLYFF